MSKKCPFCDKILTKYSNHVWRSHSEEGKLFRTGNLGKVSPFKGLPGKKHTQESKIKISETRKSRNYILTDKQIFSNKKTKCGWYEGYWCDSSWELAYVIYNLEHNIKFERNKQGFEYQFNNSICSYFPDFIIDDIYIEIKGRKKFEDLDEKTKCKILQFQQPLKVLYTQDMKFYLDYVKNKYGKDFIELYKDYVKPIKIKKQFKKYLPKVISEFETNRLDLIENRKQLILNSDINFSKFGWVGEIANLTGLLPQKVNEFMKKHLVDIYENKCFKRKKISC